MKFLSIICGLIFTFALSGCATMFGDNNKAVQIGSNPRGAKVFVNNALVGTTPTTIVVNNPLFSPPLVTLQKSGYQTQAVPINTSFQPIGILNILIWPGFIVDAVSGDMLKINAESRNIMVNMIH